MVVKLKRIIKPDKVNFSTLAALIILNYCLMKLIVDSGATKSDWVLIDNTGEKMSFQLTGMNPFYLDSKKIANILERDLIPFIETKKIKQIFFYGSGCSSVNKCMVVEEGLGRLFKCAEIKIESDLLGAARALFGNKEGLACILGTGSNSCYYDGTRIVKSIISLGYFFGDEGSGAHMGKIFIKDYLMGNLPKEINTAFIKEFNYTRDNILDAIYNLPYPNRFLASFCDFYADNLSNSYIFELVTNSFREFFFNYIEKYPNHKEVPVSFVGSVAYFFEALLRRIGTEFEVNIEKVFQSPISGLVSYHRNK
jgi:N-acetylglucosamine kinase-like BadF-type ATPase